MDGDRGVDRDISFSVASVEHEGDSYHFLDINDDGEVSFNTNVDREVFGANNVIFVTFEATEVGCSNPEPCSATAEMSLRISVSDLLSGGAFRKKS